MEETQHRRWLERLSMARNTARMTEETLIEALTRTEPDSEERTATRSMAAIAQELRSRLETALGEKGLSNE